MSRETRFTRPRKVEEIPLAELEEFGCSVRAIAMLEKAGYLTFRDLLSLTQGQLKNMPNTGEKTMKEILDAVRAHRAKHKW